MSQEDIVTSYFTSILVGILTTSNENLLRRTKFKGYKMKGKIIRQRLRTGKAEEK